MPPHVMIVMGPAGAGKSTFCYAMQEHAAAERRRVHVANLDPAADEFKYDVAFDIRDLISLEDAMAELDFGPNGGLVYCMEFLLENMDWLQEHIDRYDEEEYLILDCPGQVELYSHVPVMRGVVDTLRLWNVKMCGAYLIDATFATDTSKFISGALLSLSAMIQLELPHINVLTKCDLVDPADIEHVLQFESASVLANAMGGGASDDRPVGPPTSGRRLNRLTHAICSLLDDFTMVTFLPLNIKDEESIGLVLHTADHIMQYGEDLEPKEHNLGDGAEDT